MPATIPNFLSDLSTDTYPPENAKNVRRWATSATGLLVLPVDYTTANNAVLFTVPTIYQPDLVTALRMYILSLTWEVTTTFAGGTSSAIGVSSSNANYNTAGDLLGGSGGDLTATLVSTGSPLKGTIGTKFGSNGKVMLVAADTIKFNRIASVYTSGVGNVIVHYGLLPAA